MPELDKNYNHLNVEQKRYKQWEESGFFNPDKLPTKNKKPFSIIMPPPNATGSLHLGHALTIAIEDTIIRYIRMRGYKTLWLPGADHAGFETQVVFEKKLEKEGTSRFEILKEKNGREKLYQMIWDFTQKNKLQMEIGIQTTNDKTLNAIDRPSDIKKTICNMEKLRNLKNIKIHADLIAGLPYDDLSSFKKSFNDIFYVCDELQLGH
mgnify:CR=1 FL=1